MAAGTLPIYPKAIPGALPTAFTTANTLLDGTGTITTIATAGADGARLDRIFFKARGTVTDGMIRIFVKNGGGTYRLIDEVMVEATTPSATAVAWQTTWTPTGGVGMLLAAAAVVGVSTENNELFNALPYIGDY
jgi:hypothetical protein